jgi:protoheme IX farnesyltransferase
MPSQVIKTYYQLTKPGIIYGNLLSAAAGFLLAANGHFHLGLFIATLVGTSLVIGAACVFNNLLDRGIDAKMARTKKRALVSGLVPSHSAIIYAIVLAIVGFVVLATYVNWLVFFIGLIGIIDYVILYGLAKRHTIFGTEVGSISGATPILAGYVAVTDHLNLGAFLVFLILVVWQMPHFYAIALFRESDYKAAGIPVLPVKKGIRVTKIAMLSYIVAFIAATILLTMCDYAGDTFMVCAVVAGLAWLYYGLKGLKKGTDDIRWARKMFFNSLLVLTFLCVLMGLNYFLP